VTWPKRRARGAHCVAWPSTGPAKARPNGGRAGMAWLVHWAMRCPPMGGWYGLRTALKALGLVGLARQPGEPSVVGPAQQHS